MCVLASTESGRSCVITAINLDFRKRCGKHPDQLSVYQIHRFDALSLMNVNAITFWDIILCSLIEIHQRFVGICASIFRV
jgi:hypothetical protein